MHTLSGAINTSAPPPPVRQEFTARHRILHRDAKRYLNKSCYMMIGAARKFDAAELYDLRERLSALREEIEDPGLTRMDIVDIHSEIMNVYLELSIQEAKT